MEPQDISTTGSPPESGDNEDNPFAQIRPISSRPAVKEEPIATKMDEMFSKTIYPKDYNYSETDKARQNQLKEQFDKSRTGVKRGRKVQKLTSYIEQSLQRIRELQI